MTKLTLNSILLWILIRYVINSSYKVLAEDFITFIHLEKV